MTLIDTHSHIYLEEFDLDRYAIIQAAEKEGITKIIMPAIDATTHEAMLKVEKKYPEMCNSMMGVHPCSIKDDYQNELKIAETHLIEGDFIAVGEIGLDFYWDQTYTVQQTAAFHTQVEWALHYELPIVIHSRDSIDACIKVVSEHQDGNLKGVFHCFSGTAEQAHQIISLGFYLGIGGVVTFKNAGLDTVLEKISLDYLVLETDAPYLAPVPFRGKRNEPAYLKYVINKLAEIKKTTATEIADITTANAKKLFGC